MAVAQKNIDLTDVWKKYATDRDIETKHQLMLHYIWLVKYVLQSISLPTNSILNEEDFLSIGILGLNETIDRYELERGVKFESYAIPRIKGIIQDELRRLDWLSRSARKKAHEYLQAKDALSSQEGREVSNEEVMIKLNISPDKYNSYLAAAAAAKSSLSLTESSQVHFNDDDEEVDAMQEIPDVDHQDYLAKIEHEERMNFLTSYLGHLVEKKKLVMTLYYYENLTFKEIGKLIDVSESRVCQIHTQVVSDLRQKLKEFENA